MVSNIEGVVIVKKGVKLNVEGPAIVFSPSAILKIIYPIRKTMFALEYLLRLIMGLSDLKKRLIVEKINSYQKPGSVWRGGYDLFIFSVSLSSRRGDIKSTKADYCHMLKEQTQETNEDGKKFIKGYLDNFVRKLTAGKNIKQCESKVIRISFLPQESEIYIGMVNLNDKK